MLNSFTHTRVAVSSRGDRSRHRAASERGAALVELAVALPLLAIILIGTIDFGRAFRTAMIATDAARAGAQYGSQSLAKSGDASGMAAASAAVFAANGITPDTAPTPLQWCECASATAVIPGAVACTSTCAANQHLVVNVTVTAVATFSMVNPFPGLPASVTITRGSTMRVVN